MLYSIKEICSIIGAQCYGKHDTNVEWLLTDSRSLTFPESTLFFALKTKYGDGAAYIQQLYDRGVCNFVVSRLPEESDKVYPDCNFLVVDNPLHALQTLAEFHRKKFDLPVVAITGSNGKTVVKEWLAQILSAEYNVTRSPRSYNSQIGVPLSVWLLAPNSQVGIFEAGISQMGEMGKLQRIIQPSIGVITNIGDAHQKNFDSLEQKCIEKLSLFKDCKAIVYNEDNSLIRDCIRHQAFDATMLNWSLKDRNAFLFISDIQKDTATSFSFSTSNMKGRITIPFTDDASFENAAACLTVAVYMNVSIDTLQRRFSLLEPVAMRLEVKEGINSCTLINDSYNNDLNSLDIALDFMNRRQEHTDKTFTLILSDIYQSGMPEKELYEKVAQLVNSHNISRFIGVGETIGRNMSCFSIPTQHFADTESLIASGICHRFSNEVILIKGARAFGFDRITAIMEKKVHQTILEVNLSALVDNVNHYRHFLAPGTKMVCMVKASAYGAGSVEVARTLQDHRVDYLAVAVADEGVTLRKAGIHMGIIIMNPELTAFKEMFDNELEPEVYSFELLDALIEAARREGITNWPVHIKIDTGMHRLGFHPERDMDRLIDILSHQSAVKPRSIFSHFVGSDSASFDDFTAQQFALFDKARKKVQAAFPGKILCHICNSAAIGRFPQYHLDMVRLGLGLYGINPVDNSIIHNVCTLKSVILQLRDVPATDTVGYSRRGTLTRPSRIAAIPIGYADGLNRHLGRGKAYCLVNGHKASYVGNICMDVCMIDVTGIPCKVGDNVEIFGDNLPVTVLSDALDTIPYEILTSVSERIPRVYYQD
jgi:alanine racemase